MSSSEDSRQNGLSNSRSQAYSDDSTYDSDPELPPRKGVKKMYPMSKIFADSVHGSLILPEMCVKVIDTQEFQRLRGLKQCGPSHLVYPTAVHTRFEHSLGVCHLAGEMVDAINVNLPEGGRVSQVEKLCIMLAGLCHDLGHGPFSHLWEHFVAQAGQRFKHEDMSVEVFQRLIRNNALEANFSENGITEDKIQFICHLIRGTPNETENRAFLYEIVANSKTGIDVDKWEYMMRDGANFGIPNEVLYKRLLSGIGVVQGSDGKLHIGFREKLSVSILEVFEYRAKMHHTCYQHRVCKILEVMYIDALLAANDAFRVTAMTREGEISNKLSQCHNNVETFLKLTDHIFYEIEYSISDELAESRKILQRIAKRNLYPLIGTFTVTHLQNFNSANFEKYIQEKFKDVTGIVSACVQLDFGNTKTTKKGDDPLVNVNFFTKDEPNVPKIIKTTDLISKFYGNTKFQSREVLLLCKEDKERARSLQEKFKEIKEYAEKYPGTENL